MKLKGEVDLILLHLNQTHREQTETNILYNFNTLGLVRRAIPQYTKGNVLKGATIIPITNGGKFSTLEFLPNVQAASNATQRLTEQKTQCDPEQCPQEPLTTSGNQGGEPLEGRDRLLDLVFGGLLTKSGQTPAHTHARKHKSRSQLHFRTNSTKASDLKPYLKSITENPTTRGNFQNAKACDFLVGVAGKSPNHTRRFCKITKNEQRTNQQFPKYLARRKKHVYATNRWIIDWQENPRKAESAPRQLSTSQNKTQLIH